MVASESWNSMHMSTVKNQSLDLWKGSRRSLGQLIERRWSWETGQRITRCVVMYAFIYSNFRSLPRRKDSARCFGIGATGSGLLMSFVLAGFARGVMGCWRRDSARDRIPRYFIILLIHVSLGGMIIKGCMDCCAAKAKFVSNHAVERNIVTGIEIPTQSSTSFTLWGRL